ncbi:MlaE family lipid ABC transporter permease subunit [candidate division KSB1 bacterium]|nr:MlaE family lipid ABC transporter permease subunit [candidate division KSB1 bacterium]
MKDIEARVTYEDNALIYSGDLLLPVVSQLYEDTLAILKGLSAFEIQIDLSLVRQIDTAGSAFLDEVKSYGLQMGMEAEIINVPESISKTLSTFSQKVDKQFLEQKERQRPWLERIGNWLDKRDHEVLEFITLIADTFYFGIAHAFKKEGSRKGEFVNQCILIGMNALPIVGLVSFLIGFILALQSAAQLRQFGASIYVADLIAVAMTREMGPLITAIMIAGRSGSAITSEIATMVVTEETDALKSMGLNPVKYILVPKFYAITMTMPMLTILSMILGILGALVIGYTYLNIGVQPFIDQVANVLIMKDIVTGLIKSIIFAWLIVIVAAYFGFRVKGGAEGVGRVTTASVVVSIFAVIFADSILGLIFYFGQDVVTY